MTLTSLFHHSWKPVCVLHFHPDGSPFRLSLITNTEMKLNQSPVRFLYNKTDDYDMTSERHETI